MIYEAYDDISSRWGFFMMIDKQWLKHSFHSHESHFIIAYNSDFLGAIKSAVLSVLARNLYNADFFVGTTEQMIHSAKASADKSKSERKSRDFLQLMECKNNAVLICVDDENEYAEMFDFFHAILWMTTEKHLKYQPNELGIESFIRRYKTIKDVFSEMREKAKYEEHARRHEEKEKRSYGEMVDMDDQSALMYEIESYVEPWKPSEELNHIIKTIERLSSFFPQRYGYSKEKNTEMPSFNMFAQDLCQITYLIDYVCRNEKESSYEGIISLLNSMINSSIWKPVFDLLDVRHVFNWRERALAAAESMVTSEQRMVTRLTNLGFSKEDIEFVVLQGGLDWKKNALRLTDENNQLSYPEMLSLLTGQHCFSEEDVTSWLDEARVDWKENAVRRVNTFIDTIHSEDNFVWSYIEYALSKQGMFERLMKDHHFSMRQAEYGVEHSDVNWKESALRILSYEEDRIYDYDYLADILLEYEFTAREIVEALYEFMELKIKNKESDIQRLQKQYERKQPRKKAYHPSYYATDAIMIDHGELTNSMVMLVKNQNESMEIARKVFSTAGIIFREVSIEECRKLFRDKVEFSGESDFPVMILDFSPYDLVYWFAEKDMLKWLYAIRDRNLCVLDDLKKLSELHQTHNPTGDELKSFQNQFQSVFFQQQMKSEDEENAGKVNNEGFTHVESDELPF